MRIPGLPERSFIRRFKNMTGLSPMEYIQHTRIEHARQLLETSSLPVDTIAADIGYEDPAFFRKLFKRITSMTPAPTGSSFAFLTSQWAKRNSTNTFLVSGCTKQLIRVAWVRERGRVMELCFENRAGACNLATAKT